MCHWCVVSSAASALLWLLAGLLLWASEDTLTLRRPVDEGTFNQAPEGVDFKLGGLMLKPKGTEDELGRLRALMEAEEFSPKAATENSFAYALRAATLVQRLLTKGPPDLNLFRNWSFEPIVEASRQGGKFWCDDYSRLVVVLALAADVPGRSVWMDGHVVSEVYDSDREKWIMVDAMYNHYMVNHGAPLSVLEIRHLLHGGVFPELRTINRSAELDEPSVRTLTRHLRSVYEGSSFKVFDGDINFRSDRPHVLLPAFSLITPGLPGGTTWSTQALRFLVVFSGLVALGLPLGHITTRVLRRSHVRQRRSEQQVLIDPHSLFSVRRLSLSKRSRKFHE